MPTDSSQYRVNFLNQYAKIPEEILSKLDTLYPTEYEGVRHCIGLLIVNLLEYGEVAYSRNKNFYTKNKTKNYTYANMLNALRIALDAGYAVAVQTGYSGSGTKPGTSSTLKAGLRLAEFGRPQKMEIDVELLPLLSIDEKPIFEREELEIVRARNAEANPELRALIDRLGRVYDEALELNRNYWNKMIIDTGNIVTKQKCFSHVGLTRIFKDGGVGRWYQKGEMSFQQLPKEDRAKLLLNGEKVTEIDYSAMHPHILYAWEGKQCPGDFYEDIVKRCGCSRFIAKAVTLIAINARSYVSLVGAINNNKKEQERANINKIIPEPILYDEIKNFRLTPKEVVKAIKEAHPIIEKYVYGASANKLMLVESDIMTSVLLELMELNIPALPVHDSVVVPSRYEDTARRIMQDSYREHTGFNIVIK